MNPVIKVPYHSILNTVNELYLFNGILDNQDYTGVYYSNAPHEGFIPCELISSNILGSGRILQVLFLSLWLMQVK